MGTTLTEMGEGLCSPVAPLPSLKGAAVQQAVTMQDPFCLLASAHLFPAEYSQALGTLVDHSQYMLAVSIAMGADKYLYNCHWRKEHKCEKCGPIINRSLILG